MVDIVSPEKRSSMMSGIRGRNTKPELIIRKSLHAKGYRYRLHDKKLPAKADIVLKKYNAVILIHGCFWHKHDCHLFKWPSSKVEFWQNKITGNRMRDAENFKLLRGQRWRLLVIWECAIKGKEKLPLDSLIKLVITWLHSNQSHKEIRGIRKKMP